jgi:putative copper resistance protein D
VALLIDLFGYLSIILHGLTIVAQSMTLGGVMFLALLVRPLARRLGRESDDLPRRCERLSAFAALAMAACSAAGVALETAALVGTLDISAGEVLGAEFAVAGLVKTIAALLIALTLFRRRGAVLGTGRLALLLTLSALILAAATATTHAAARLDDRALLLTVEALHQAGAAIWIGGIPCFLIALAGTQDGTALRLIGARFSRMSMTGVACILVSGIAMSLIYVGDWQGFYGTAYGVMVGAKIAMFLMLLALGGMNFLLVQRLRGRPDTPILQLRRFAEVEIGIGVTIFFAAASLTSVPPAVDLQQDRVTWQEIAERNTPEWPRLQSPDHDTLALPALQSKLDAEAAHQSAPPQVAFVPGSGELPPRNAADIAWSEYNHHWAGLFVLAIGVLALLNKAGVRTARHWPLLFVLLAGFLFVRSDPETWPLGDIGFFESLRDVEVLQHRAFVLLVVVFALFEWRVQATGRRTGWPPLVFPLMSAGGGALLLTHSHAIANVKDQLLIELTHTPLALSGIIVGWSRWLELRLNPPTSRIAGWVWPIGLMLSGAILLLYREA